MLKKNLILIAALSTCASFAMVQLTGCSTSAPDLNSTETTAVLRSAQQYADRFYKIDGCSAGKGFVYGFKTDGDTVLVKVQPPAYLHTILKMTIRRSNALIVNVQQISR